jgi:hypothetical protein
VNAAFAESPDSNNSMEGVLGRLVPIWIVTSLPYCIIQTQAVGSEWFGLFFWPNYINSRFQFDAWIYDCRSTKTVLRGR